ncbi:hypothetical protein QL285_062048 [Trifolium repens]|nr:hypothetical protein QL285_062048 [Trifolium repens]
MIVMCLICPNENGQICYTSYVQYIENLEEVNSYAWGAAMLAYLYQGMKDWKKKGKSLDGFTWLIMGFFFSHCKGLYGIYNIIVEGNQTYDKPTLAYLIESLLRIDTNHHSKLNNALHAKLTLANNLLTTEDIEANVITWHPYTSETLPPHMHDQIKYRTVVPPLFCYNYVEHHLPHLVAKQFDALDQVDLIDVGSDLTKIKFKGNKVYPFLRLPSVNDSRSSCRFFDSSIQFRPFTINDLLSSTLLFIQFASPNHPSKASVQLSYLLPFRDIDVSPPTSTQSVDKPHSSFQIINFKTPNPSKTMNFNVVLHHKASLNEKWKQWKSDLKSKAYDPSKTEEEVASVKPDSRVDLNQWRKLVHHWFSEEGQKISKINRENRAKFKDVHCMGTKSLPKLIDEKKKNANGRSPTRKEIYIETRTRKDGSIVNEKARGVIEKLNKYDNETGTSQSVEEIQSDMPWKDDIYSKVKGTEKRGEQRGRLRCIGKIPKPKKLKVSLAENQELRDKVKQMEKKQDNTNAVLANVLSLIQNRFAGEDVNDILRAARQVTDASNAPDQTDSPSGNDDNENENADGNDDNAHKNAGVNDDNADKNAGGDDDNTAENVRVLNAIGVENLEENAGGNVLENFQNILERLQ